MSQLADVVSLPTRSTREPERSSSFLEDTVVGAHRRVNTLVGGLTSTATAGVRAATRRLTRESLDSTDDWGRDPMLVRNMMFLAQMRWDVSTGGDQHLPKQRGALVVVNSPRLSNSAIFAAFAISEAIDRPVRFVAQRELLPVTAIDRRIGGLLAHPDELAGALRADEVVVLGAAPTNGLRSVGTVDHTLIGAALATSTRVFPAGTTSSPFDRRARVEIGAATHPPRRRRGPLTELELAERVRSDIHDLLDEMGNLGTGTPLDWLPLTGGGGN